MRTLLAVLAIAVASPTLACAPAPHAGERIDIVEETALIVWDPATKTQHFIRRATFRGEARDFGFLVPTPAVPTLAEFNDSVFATLEEKTTPQRVIRTRKAIDWTPLVAMFMVSKSEVSTGAASVEVLSTEKIAGYEASVLDATDAEALQKWLADHGYATTPDLTEWLDAYIQKRWKITAFKVDKPAQTSAVRMTFTTEQPFFPYREPASQRESSQTSRRLRIFFLGPERVEGKIGGQHPWPHTLMWSERLKFDVGLPVPANARLTRFEDTATSRPGTDDLFFARSPDQAEMVPEPFVIEKIDETWVPLDVVIAPVLLLGFFGVRRAVRKR
jgi:hypothetical protein